MNKTTIKLLEYDKIKEKLKEHALSDMGKNMIDCLQPSLDINRIRTWLAETTEARAIVNKSSSLPIHSLAGVKNIIDKVDKGMVLLPEELSSMGLLLKDCEKLKRFMKDKEPIAPTISSYALSISPLAEISRQIDNCIDGSRVADSASPELNRLRRRIAASEDKIKARLESIIRSDSFKKYLQDSYISVRHGRYVIPVRSEYRGQIKGTVVDMSGSSSTVFIEPEGIRAIHDEMELLKVQEENETYRVLAELTSMIELNRKEIMINIETMANYDFLFAKAKYSRAIEGNSVEINENYELKIVNGRHPLIEGEAVPLNFEIGYNYRALVITGPNTGGKTVAIKTVGLLSMMVQSGLHVPVMDGSIFPVFSDILADIGDGQSIQESLSTFSSHIRNITSIMKCAGKGVLVILDELGSGTDPQEGMGLAVSILERLYESGATILATTHHSELKELAGTREGFENGCMEFDINTLKPLYRLKIGQSGESNAFLIALKLGMDVEVIERAHEVTYGEKADYGNMISNALPALENEDVIETNKRQMENMNERVRINKAARMQAMESSFKIGDCVYVSSLGRTGIVYELENSKGEVGVIYEKKKIKVNKKRLSLYIDSKELYPEDYDFDIIFESKENRKKRHKMDKGHGEGLTIEIKDGAKE